MRKEFKSVFLFNFLLLFLFFFHHRISSVPSIDVIIWNRFVLYEWSAWFGKWSHTKWIIIILRLKTLNSIISFFLHPFISVSLYLSPFDSLLWKTFFFVLLNFFCWKIIVLFLRDFFFPKENSSFCHVEQTIQVENNVGYRRQKSSK